MMDRCCLHGNAHLSGEGVAGAQLVMQVKAGCITGHSQRVFAQSASPLLLEANAYGGGGVDTRWLLDCSWSSQPQKGAGTC